MTPTCVHTCSTSASRWLETNTVVPSSANERMSARTSRVPCGSSPFVGSSSTSSSRGMSSAFASPSRCFMPSEYACAFLRAACESPTRSSASATRAVAVRARRVPVGGVEAAQVRLARQEGRERRPLHERADARQHRVHVPRHVGAEHARVARGRRDQAQQHPDRGGLARAVRPEEPEHGPARHREVEAVDGESGIRSAW